METKLRNYTILLRGTYGVKPKLIAKIDATSKEHARRIFFESSIAFAGVKDSDVFVL